MKKWFRNKLRKWLGVDENETALRILNTTIQDLVSIGVDVSPSMRDPHMIVIVSKMAGGQCRIIPAHFNSLRELEELTRHLRKQYNTEISVFDCPRHMQGFFGD